MNIDRLSGLADWLDEGAPGVAFNMFAIRQPISYVLGPEGDPMDARMILRQVAEKNLTQTDICCGLDGAAVQLFDPVFPMYAPEHFERVQERALELLGLPRMDKGPRWDCAHDLFDPTNAPDGCSPRQAAQAVRRLIAGQDPWPGL